eukprot:scaffold16402_cov118-Isochrysis_galbana.AAC.1
MQNQSARQPASSRSAAVGRWGAAVYRSEHSKRAQTHADCGGLCVSSLSSLVSFQCAHHTSYRYRYRDDNYE